MINIEQADSSLKISYFNEKGEIDMLSVQIPQNEYYEWYYAKTSKHDLHFKSWNNKPVIKNNSKFLSSNRIKEFLAKQPEHVHERIYQYNMPKKFFVDIEVNNDDEWPEPSIARHEITAISFSHGQLLVVMGLNELSKSQVEEIEKSINEYLATKEYPPIEFRYIYYKTEYDMIFTFFNKWIQKMPLITGWNFVEFDWAYLVNRCKKLAIDPGVASPSKKLYGKNQLPMHRVVVDYMAIYKKWDRVVFKENNSLDYVATQATGLGKIKYNGTLADLYTTDFQKYIYYNAIDSVLVRLIDEKISTMDSMFSLAKVTKSEILNVFSPISMTENVMVTEFFKRGKVFTNERRKLTEKEEYEGAFVFEPIPDLLEWCASFDYASLYPSTMRQWNMSPESYLGKMDKKLFDDPEFVKDPNVIYSASGAMFDGKEDSVFRVILNNLYAKRREAKDAMETVELEMEELKRMKERLK